MAEVFLGVDGYPVAIYRLENGWTVQVDYRNDNTSGYIDIPTHVYNGDQVVMFGYLEAWVNDPRNRDKVINSDTEIVAILATIAKRPPIGPAAVVAEHIAAMIEKARK